MENSTLFIDSKTRQQLSNGNRIYQFIYGVILITIGAFRLINIDSALFNMGFIVLGILSLIYGAIGKEIFTTHNYVKIDSNLITSKKAGDRKKLIEIKSITYIKTLPSAFDFTLNDYVKTINFVWMTSDEFRNVKSRIKELSLGNKIEMD